MTDATILVPTFRHAAQLDAYRREPGFAEELAREVAEVVREAAVVRKARIHELKGAVSEIQSTRLWRLRTGLATSWPRRALLARRRGAR